MGTNEGGKRSERRLLRGGSTSERASSSSSSSSHLSLIMDGEEPPKRPPSAYLLFMSDFRQEYKRINPEGFKKVTEVAKAGAAKWKAYTDAEKNPYQEDAQERKSAFLKMYPDP